MSQAISNPPTKRRRGQPSLLTPATAKRICDFVRSGNYPETAAQAAGVSRTTLLGWLKEGAAIRRRLGDNAPTARLSEHRRALVDFSTDLERAFSEAEARDVMLVGRAAQGTDKRPGDWRAAAFLLERRNRQRWAPQHDDVELSVGSEGSATNIQRSLQEVRIRVVTARPDSASDVPSKHGG